MKSCRIVVRRSPWGRLGSLLDVRKRLHRTRGGFHRCIHISKVLCALLLWTICDFTYDFRLDSLGVGFPQAGPSPKPRNGRAVAVLTTTSTAGASA